MGRFTDLINGKKLEEVKVQGTVGDVKPQPQVQPQSKVVLEQPQKLIPKPSLENPPTSK